MLHRLFLAFSIMVLATSTALAQSDSGIIRNLVFEGAGIRGIAYSGAIRALEENGIIKNVQRIGGTSAGAVTALTLALGYSADEIATLITTTPIQKFNDGGFLFIGGITRLKKHFGWYKGKAAEEWIGEIIAARTGDANISFMGLREKGFKDLYITGTSLDEQKVVLFSADTYPAMKVRDAVRISMGIPFYFEPLYMDSTGATARRKKGQDGWHLMMDGGFLANYPLHLFDSIKFIVPSANNSFLHNRQTIGFRIDSKEQVARDASDNGLAAIPTKDLNDYMRAFYTLVIEGLNRQQLTDADWARTVSIPDCDLGPRIRKLKQKEVEALMHSGYSATKAYLEKRP